MIRQFFRQAWTMMKQHKFFTGVYITGTAVSITLAMTLFIIFYISIGNIYPEYGRDRMLVIKYMQFKKKQGGATISSNCGASTKMAELIESEAKHLENIGIRLQMFNSSNMNINVDGKDAGTSEAIAVTDGGYWKVFDHRFVSGLAYTEKEESENVAVLSRSFAMQLFADTAVSGRRISIKNIPYRIVGVVEDAPAFMKESAGEIYLPYNSSGVDKYPEDYIDGNCILYMTAPSVGEREALKSEVEDIVNRMKQNVSKEDEYTIGVWEHWRLGLMAKDDSSFLTAISKYLYVLLALLFIPALNLSGLISSRMNGRMTEVGVRKAYGATNRQIIWQVLWENLLLTLGGAVAGLIMSYIVVYTCSNWIVTFFEHYIEKEYGSEVISTEMLMNPTMLGCTILLTLLLNIASALLPTLLALKKDIVQSLYHRR